MRKNNIGRNSIFFIRYLNSNSNNFGHHFCICYRNQKQKSTRRVYHRVCKDFIWGAKKIYTARRFHPSSFSV